MADGSITIDTKMDSKEVIKELDKLGIKMKEVGENGNGFFNKMGSSLKGIASTGLKSMAIGLGAIATGTIALGKSAISAYADYEQLVGGVETLFKDSSDTVLKYSQDAYKTANMSANQYMNTITSFSASLIQSLNGDTKKASEVGNRAIIDMSDNANKMGTSIESIQNAYQGFAKQNYTMLDNLKLGYGGTKEEMQRLITDASKMSDIQDELNISVEDGNLSFSNIVNAISVMQKKLDITGTTAKESASTIQGSVNTMKSAWQNMLVAIADENANFEQSLMNLIESIVQVAKNVGKLIPTIIKSIVPLISGLIDELLPNALTSITNLLNELLPSIITTFEVIIQEIAKALPQVTKVLVEIVPMLIEGVMELLPVILETGITILTTLMQGIAQMLPNLIPMAIECIVTLVTTLIEHLPEVIKSGLEIILALIEGIVNTIPKLIDMLPTIIETISNVLTDNLPTIIDMGIEILISLINGIVNCLPKLIDMLPTIIDTIINVLMNNLPLIIDSGIKILVALINGITQAIPKLINMLPTIISTIVRTLINNLPQIIRLGGQILSSLISGIGSMLGSLGSMASSIVSTVVNVIGRIPSQMINIGRNIINGLWNGISSMASSLYNKVASFASGITDKIKSVFKIFSPSRVMRDEIGVMLIKGIGVGFDKETPNLEKNIDGNMSDLINSMSTIVNFESSKFAQGGFGVERGTSVTNNDNGITQNVTIVNPERTPSENARLLKQVARGLVYG